MSDSPNQTNPSGPSETFTPVEVQQTDSSVPEGGVEIAGAAVKGFKAEGKKNPDASFGDKSGAAFEAAKKKVLDDFNSKTGNVFQ